MNEINDISLTENNKLLSGKLATAEGSAVCFSVYFNQQIELDDTAKELVLAAMNMFEAAGVVSLDVSVVSSSKGGCND